MIFGINESLIHDFLRTFIENTKNLLEELNTVIHERDENSAKAKCHRLKGACGNAGADHLYHLAMKQEMMIIKKDWQEVSSLQKELLLGLETLKQIVF